MIRKSRRGSVTVFICIFFTTMVVMILAFTGAAKKTAIRSSADALCSLWANSILAEYDRNLKNRYSVLGYYGYPSDVKKKVEFYAGQSFDRKKYIAYQVTGSSLYEHSLANADVMEKQLCDAGKLAFTEKFVRPDPHISPVERAEGSDAGTAPPGRLFAHLPSEGSNQNFSLSQTAEFLKGGGSVKDAAAKTGKSWLINQYIFAYLKDALDEKGLGETYFSREIEYVICGRKSDSANQTKIRNRIIALREPLNFLYLNRDPVKRAQAAAAAALLAPGPATAAAQQAILAAWALAESINDYKLLIFGYKVPTMKTETSWAIDLASVLANRAEGCIDTGNRTGEDYQDYLALFLSLTDRRVRVLRVMDIIQINMRHLYYDSFLLGEYNGGVHFILNVNGDEHEVVEVY